MDQLSDSQIDKLGERLRRTSPTENDLRLLDLYRSSFQPAFEAVEELVASISGAQPTARPAKTSLAVIAKLRREKSRLSRIQDIAGCRVVVRDVSAQNQLVARLLSAFDHSAKLIDRRERPRFGYRAVHLVVEHSIHPKKPVEIQVRTELQHSWALLSERLSAENGMDIKYGGGPEWCRDVLEKTAAAVARLEADEVTICELKERLDRLEPRALARKQEEFMRRSEVMETQIIELKLDLIRLVEDLLVDE